MTETDRTGERTRAQSRRTRRRFLAASAAGTAGLLAGCSLGGGGGTDTPDDGDGDGTDDGDGGGSSDPAWYGSGPGEFESRPAPGGTSMADMPDLEGSLTVYSGRGKALVSALVDHIDERYPDFEPDVQYGRASDLARKIQTEGSGTPADVFYSVNAGALAVLASEGRTSELSDDTSDLVGEAFRPGDGSWVGTSGRARSVPYNTETLSESDVPDDVSAFTDLTEYEGDVAWAPDYSSFHGFVSAMIALEGEAATREWINGMQDLNVQSYADEQAIALAVADGELSLGLTNHYYIQRVLADRPDAPLSTAFTSGDAGSVFNVAGAATTDVADDQDLADLFVRHLLSSEAQEFFAVRTFEYPLVDGVDPVGRLPSISELDVPDVDYGEISNLDTTLDLLRDEGVL